MNGLELSGYYFFYLLVNLCFFKKADLVLINFLSILGIFDNWDLWPQIPPASLDLVSALHLQLLEEFWYSNICVLLNQFENFYAFQNYYLYILEYSIWFLFWVNIVIVLTKNKFPFKNSVSILCFEWAMARHGTALHCVLQSRAASWPSILDRVLISFIFTFIFNFIHLKHMCIGTLQRLLKVVIQGECQVDLDIQIGVAGLAKITRMWHILACPLSFLVLRIH